MSEVITLADADAVAEAVARAVRARVRELQAVQRQADVQLCLTGGGIANRMYQRLAGDPDEVNWKRVEFWWGDERYVPTGDPDRNAGQSLAILAGAIPLDAAKVHSMPSADGSADLTQAAVQYAEELGDTRFDICLLGMGADGHIASIFPNHSSLAPTSSTVLAVRNAPKPPAERMTLSLGVLNASTEVWLMVSGEEKAEALARVLNGDLALPASRVAGVQRTMWWIDEAAASRLG